MKTAVVLAGGKGTRLYPYTVAIPKPLVPIDQTPIAEVLLRQLKAAGFERAILAVNHQADILRAYFQDGSRWGIDIRYSLESEPLGTMGPLRLISDLPQHFLVINGDVLTDLDIEKFLADHEEADRLFSISAYEREQIIDFGVLQCNASHSLVGFEEKPKLKLSVSMGVYAVNREILAHIPAGRPFGFDQLMLKLIGLNKPVHVHRHAGFWLDIGRPDDYGHAVASWDSIRQKLRY